MAEVDNDLCTACNGTGLENNFKHCEVCGGTPSAKERAKLQDEVAKPKEAKVAKDESKTDDEEAPSKSAS